MNFVHASTVPFIRSSGLFSGRTLPVVSWCIYVGVMIAVPRAMAQAVMLTGEAKMLLKLLDINNDGILQGHSFQLGPVSIDGFNYIELDLSPYIAYFGVPLGGVVGFDFIARVVADVDLANGRITINNPQSYRLKDGAWRIFTMSGRTPAINATFEGDYTGLFALDTGANSTVTFHTVAQQAFKPLVDRAKGRGLSQGVGGTQTTAIGPLAWLTIGDQRFENLTVSFSLATAGALTDPYTADTIGGNLFVNHRIVFDYTHQRLTITRSR